MASPELPASQPCKPLARQEPANSVSWEAVLLEGRQVEAAPLATAASERCVASGAALHRATCQQEVTHSNLAQAHATPGISRCARHKGSLRGRRRSMVGEAGSQEVGLVREPQVWFRDGMLSEYTEAGASGRMGSSSLR